MHSKTKIVVLHMKELVYTGIFAALGILFIVLCILMFFGNKDTTQTMATNEKAYIPGVYTTALSLGNDQVEIEVCVDESHINSIRLLNLSEAVTTMYPLIGPSFESLASQVQNAQSLEGITFEDENRYTYTVLLNAIDLTLEKARKTPKAPSQ